MSFRFILKEKARIRVCCRGSNYANLCKNSNSAVKENHLLWYKGSPDAGLNNIPKE